MFIKKLEFIDKCQGFEKGDKIKFENNQKELINFYIKTTKKIKENEKSGFISNKLQINCILGNNGAGKSLLLGHIMSVFEEKLERINEKKLSLLINDTKLFYPDSLILMDSFTQDKEILVRNNMSYIYDDFFIGSEMFSYSINNKIAKDLVNGNGLNDFYCDIFNFLTNKETNKEIFSNFLNIPSSYSYEIFWYHNFKEDNYDYIDSKKLFVFFDFLNSSISLKNNKLYEKLYKMFSLEQVRLFYLRFMQYLLPEFAKWGSENKHTKEEYNIFLDAMCNYLLIIKDLDVTEEEFKNINLIQKLKKYNSLNIVKKEITKVINIVTKYKNQQKYNEVFQFKDLKISKTIITLISRYSNFLNKLPRFFIKTNNKNQEEELILNGFSKNIEGFSAIEKTILGLEFFKLDLKFKYGENLKENKSFSNLSSGEKIMLIRFVNIYMEIFKKYDNGNGKTNFIILIDEPDLHLHLDWQKVYIQRLIDVFSTIKESKITMHFILATHSPFIISDLPKENIIKLKKKKNEIYSKQVEYEKESFGANYIDILKNGFFQDGVLMGSFSADIINNLALIEKFKLLKGKINIEELNEFEKNIYYNYVENNSNTEIITKLKDQIGDDFIKNNLLYFNFLDNKND